MAGGKFVDPAGRSRRSATREMKDFTCRFILFPEKWVAYPGRVAVLKWQRVKFDANIRRRLPADKHGIYSFILEPAVAAHSAVGYMLYIGKADKLSLRDRCSKYLYEAHDPKGRVLVQEMLERWPQNLWLHFTTLEDTGCISQLESDLLEAFIPPFNHEFPATIRRQVDAIFRS